MSALSDQVAALQTNVLAGNYVPDVLLRQQFLIMNTVIALADARGVMIDALTVSVADLQSRLTAAEAGLVTASGDILDIGNDLTTVDNTIADHETRIASEELIGADLTTRVAALEVPPL